MESSSRTQARRELRLNRLELTVKLVLEQHPHRTGRGGDDWSSWLFKIE